MRGPTPSRRQQFVFSRATLVAAALLVIPALLVFPAISGCKDKDDGTSPDAVAELPPLSVDKNTENLILTWVDQRGGTHVEMRVDDVPVKGRDLVRVVISDSEHGNTDPIYVANLNHVGPDGKVKAESMRRRKWEELIAEKRESYLASLRPQKDDDDDKDAANGSVIIYGASWCGACHDAEKYLKRQGVDVVVKDVEKDPSAHAEMQSKLQRAGRSGGGIPIIDVGGQILVGFNPQRLDRALQSSRGSTRL